MSCFQISSKKNWWDKLSQKRTKLRKSTNFFHPLKSKEIKTLIKILKVNCNAKRIGKIINDFSIEREAIYESAVTD